MLKQIILSTYENYSITMKCLELWKLANTSGSVLFTTDVNNIISKCTPHHSLTSLPLPLQHSSDQPPQHLLIQSSHSQTFLFASSKIYKEFRKSFSPQIKQSTRITRATYAIFIYSYCYLSFLKALWRQKNIYNKQLSVECYKMESQLKIFLVWTEWFVE